MTNARLNFRDKFLAVKWILFVLLFFVFIFIVLQLLRSPTLNEDEVINRVEKIYGGQVDNVIHSKGSTTVLFTRESSKFEVDVDKRTGSFSNLVLIFEGPKSSQEENTTDTGGAIYLITPDEANAIATSKYFGEVQSNQFIEDAERSYYEIKISSTTQSYTIHIAAQTGEITLVRIDS